MERSDLTHIVGALVFLLLFSNMLCVGLRQSWPELLAFWRRPGLLLRSLLAIDVLIPLALFLVVKALPELGPHVRFAILTMAAASTGPLVLRRLAKIGTSAAYAVSLQLTVAILAIVSAPVTIALFSLGDLQIIPGEELHISPSEAARQVIQAQLSGLALGLLIRHFWPAVADKISHPMLRLAQALYVGSLLLLVLVPFIVVRMEWLGLAVMALCVAISIAIGHLLGGPRPDTRVTLATLASTRNLGLALAIAGASLPQPLEVQAVIVVYMVVEQVLQIPYVMWQKRVAARHAHEARSAPA
jgi:BASS family bile acid:Na+ symporter